MSDELLAYYNSELTYLRELGGEFAEMYPKVAGRLHLAFMGIQLGLDELPGGLDNQLLFFGEREIHGIAFQAADAPEVGVF